MVFYFVAILLLRVNKNAGSKIKLLAMPISRVIDTKIPNATVP